MGYAPHTWQDGETITADLLNNMEAGIREASQPDLSTAAATGNHIVLDDAADAPLDALTVYGKTTQDGTPTPEAPVELVSAGDDGGVSVTVSAEDGSAQTAAFPYTLHGIPVDSGGSHTDGSGQQWVCDTVEVSHDGTGKLVRRTSEYTFTGVEDWMLVTGSVSVNYSYYLIKTDVIKNPGSRATQGMYCDKFQELPAATIWSTNVIGCSYGSTNSSQIRLGFGLDSEITTADLLKEWLAANPTTVVYRLNTPTETALTAEDVQAFLALKTYKPVTTILNDEGADMTVEYVMASTVQEFVEEHYASKADILSGPIVQSPGGKKFRITVDDSGAVAAAEVT